MYIDLASAKIEAPVYAFQKALLQWTLNQWTLNQCKGIHKSTLDLRREPYD